MTFTSREMKPILLVFAFISPICLSLPEQGVWPNNVDQINGFVAVSKVVYKNSALHIKVNCDEPRTKATKINISFIVWLLPCYERGLQFDKTQDLEDMKVFHEHPSSFHLNNIQEESSYFVNEAPIVTYDCVAHGTIVLNTLDANNFVKHKLIPVGSPTTQVEKISKLVDEKTSSTSKSSAVTEASSKGERKRDVSDVKDGGDASEAEVATTTLKMAAGEKIVGVKNKSDEVTVDANGDQPQLLYSADSVSIVSVLITPVNFEDQFRASVEIEIKGPDGYLSATEWPLLPFYGTMCVVYVFYGIGWLIISACQWRDLLRIQFWIGGVIFLGMLEKAVFFGEYQALNNTGKSVRGAVIAAEIVSCLKRTLARMLIIIVSLGFGIVKPRLGPLLHRVVGVGALYFILSLVEGLMRVLGVRNDPYHQFWLATISLAVLDSFICYWIFTSLVQTTRTLRLRRNIVKLNLYRHFTNTLIFAVVASVAFMIWSLRTYQGLRCINDWKELWIDEAYWRLFFSVILLVIMILWRPTNNNQRFAFTPLLDAPDDDEEDEEIPLPDAFDGMKMRGNKNQNHVTKGVEEDLKWIDENIPSGISDVALPSLLDSDEEIMTTKFEMSKMN